MSEPKLKTPSNPRTKSERFADDKRLADDTPRRKDGDQVANDIERMGTAAVKTGTARRNPDINSVDVAHSRDGAHKANII